MPFVASKEFCMLEMVRLLVEAVAKKPVPFAVRFVVLAPPFMEKRPLVMVDDAVETNPAVVSSPPIFAAPDVCSVPFVVFRVPMPRPPVRYVLPPIDNVVAGDVVPMPKLPVAVKTDESTLLVL